MIPVEQLLAPTEQVILEDMKGHAISTCSNNKNQVKVILTSSKAMFLSPQVLVQCPLGPMNRINNYFAHQETVVLYRHEFEDSDNVSHTYTLKIRSAHSHTTIHGHWQQCILVSLHLISLSLTPCLICY